VAQSLTPTLKDVTGEELSLVRRIEKEIRRWYLKDLESISSDNNTDFSIDQIYSSFNSFGRDVLVDRRQLVKGEQMLISRYQKIRHIMNTYKWLDRWSCLKMTPYIPLGPLYWVKSKRRKKI
jgi:hypothetical protein